MSFLSNTGYLVKFDLENFYFEYFNNCFNVIETNPSVSTS